VFVLVCVRVPCAQYFFLCQVCKYVYVCHECNIYTYLCQVCKYVYRRVYELACVCSTCPDLCVCVPCVYMFVCVWAVVKIFNI